uniref:ATP sulfurylase n=1 Tax=Arundo donax TaxID=35708 RepID=A0A0A9GXL7_ARUDO
MRGSSVTLPIDMIHQYKPHSSVRIKPNVLVLRPVYNHITLVVCRKEPLARYHSINNLKHFSTSRLQLALAVCCCSLMASSCRSIQRGLSSHLGT